MASEPEKLEDGTLGLPCGALYASHEIEDWRIDHLPACGVCLGNFGAVVSALTVADVKAIERVGGIGAGYVDNEKHEDAYYAALSRLRGTVLGSNLSPSDGEVATRFVARVKAALRIYSLTPQLLDAVLEEITDGTPLHTSMKRRQKVVAR